MRITSLSLSLLAVSLTLSTRLLAENVPADPATYLAKLSSLKPGDTLELAAGDYTNGMNLFAMNGAAGQPITIAGPASGSPARFLGKSGKNTVDIKNSSYLVIKNLLFDGQGIQDIDAIKAGGLATDWAHHITIENCTIKNHDGNLANQQIVGISTKIVTWDWVVRGNVIDGAGTGLYLGNSDGTRAFIGGLIEGNLVRKVLGYAMQVKHQLHRQQADVAQVPTDPRVTIIRHNVFIKQNLPSPDGPRPNLLVDGFPDSGPGASDHYEIYGNLFFHNDVDALLQASGRVHVHDNVFVDSKNPALRLVNHQGKTVIDALVYNNTIYSTATGIAFSSAPSGTSWVAGNAIFSAQPLSGVNGGIENVTGAVANAATFFVAPSITLGQMSFFPKSGGGLKGAAIDPAPAKSDADYDRDFNGTQKDFTYRGAYHGEGTNPGWQLADDKKPLGGAAGSGGAGGAPSGGGGSSAGGASGGASSGGASSGGASSGGVESGGAPGTGGSATGGKSAASSDDEGGCGCRTAGAPSGQLAWTLLALLAVGRRRFRFSSRI